MRVDLRHGRRVAVVLALSIGSAVSGWGCRAKREPEPRTAPAPRVTSAIRTPEPPCRVEAPIELARAAALPDAVAVAAHGENALVAHARSADELALEIVHATEVSHASVRFPHAEGLFALAHLDGGYVVLANGACGAGACLSALALDENGSPIGRPIERPLPARIERTRRHVDGSSLWFACSSASSPPWLDTFSLGPRGLAHVRRLFPVVLGDEGRRADVVHATARGDSFALLFRVGPLEDPEGRVMLATERGVHDVPALQEAATIESARLDDGRYRVVASFEFGRPLVLTFDERGRLAEAPIELPPHATLPHPFDARPVATLEDDGRTLALSLRSPAADPLGSPVPLASRSLAHASAASVTRFRHGFLVAYADGRGAETVVLARRVRCDGVDEDEPQSARRARDVPEGNVP